MLELSKELVDSFANAVNIKSYENCYNNVASFIDEAMTNIIKRNSLIKSYKLIVANEVFSGTEYQASKLDIFLCLDAKQMELNFLEKKSFHIKEILVNFKNTFRESFRLRKKKYNQKKLKKEENKLILQENYDILTFYNDLQIQLCKQLYKTSSVGISKNCIKLFGKDEFGIAVNIYPIFTNGETYKLYNIKTKKEVIIDFRNRFINLEEINLKTKSLFKLQVRVFNNLYYNIFKSNPNQIFMESLLYNVPLDFYTNNIYETTIGIINYIKNFQFGKMISICDNNINLFDDPLNTIQIENAYRFIKSINF